MLSVGAENKLKKFHEQSLIRTRRAIEKREKNFIWIDGNQCINFCSSDYLGLYDNPNAKNAFIHAIETYGIGSTASPMVCGYTKLQQKFELAFADFLQRDKALFFNSGYTANIGVLTALGTKDTYIISDKLCHASLLDGAKLARAKHLRFKHNNLAHLQSRLSTSHHNIVITESVFSMQGDFSPLTDTLQILKHSRDMLIVDDAHSIGWLGNNGGGICEHLQLDQQKVACLITPLGKAFAGSGAMVSGNNAIIETILQLASTYRFSTALPPAICAAQLQLLNIIKKEHWRREKLNELILFFIAEAKKRSLPLMSDDITPIKCFLIGNNHAIQTLQQNMLKKGFFISCIRPPTVPVGTARVRISLNCGHEKQQIIALLDSFAELLSQMF